MFTNVPYDRSSALEYARTWAMKRNPAYLNFDDLGGDCTNFASQCIFAGCGIMNYTPEFGWFYINSYNRTASWSGVEYLYQFLTGNKAAGPYAEVTDANGVEPGDIVQFGNAENHFYHSPVVVEVTPEEIRLAAHTFDAYQRPMESYEFHTVRFLHIAGVRKYR